MGAGFVFALGSAALCGAGPAPEGTEVTVGAAYGRYELRQGGCAGATRRSTVVEPAVHAGLRHRFDSGLTLGADGSVAPGVDSSSTPDDPNLGNPLLWSGSAAVRAGLQGERLGFNLGPARVWRPEADRGFWVPSGDLWVGRPDWAYAWASVVDAPHTGALELAALGGIGHRSRFLHIEAGTSGAGWLGRVGFATGPGAWINLELAGGRVYDNQELADLRGRLSFSLLPRQLREQAARDATPPAR